MNSCNDIGRCRQGSNSSAHCCQLYTDKDDPVDAFGLPLLLTLLLLAVVLVAFASVRGDRP